MAGFLGTISGQVRLNISQAVAAYAALRAQNARTVYALRGTGDAFVRSGQQMAVAGAGLIYIFGKAVKAAAEFERKMDFFGAVTNATEKQMARLREEILTLAETSIYSADAITDGVVELGKAGVKTKDIIQGIGQAMVNLGAAGDIPLQESGQIITSTIQQFDLAAKDAVQVVDLLAGAANASIADITDIGVSLKYVGGVANAVGLTFEDTTTAISLLAKAGIRGSTAGTSLRQMLVSLGGATGPARETLKELGILLDDGTNLFFDQEGSVKSLAQVYQILQDHTADLTNKERLMALRTIFNNRALAAGAILTREGAKGFREMNKEMSKVSAAEVASKRLDNLSGEVEILQSNIQTFLIRAGTPFQETLRGWVRNLTKLVQAFGKLDPQTQKMIVQTVGITGSVLLALGAFNIILGTLFKFVAHMIKMGAALGFVGRLLKIVFVNAKWFAVLFGGPLLAALGAITAPIWIVIGVIAALVVAFVIAYKKIDVFREFVDKMVTQVVKGVMALLKWFKLLATDPGKAWDQLKKALAVASKAIGRMMKSLGKIMLDGLKTALAAVGRFAVDVLKWFASLPGKLLGLLKDLMGKLIGLFTMDNLVKVIQFGLQALFFLWVGLRLRLIALALNLVEGIFKVFGFLGPKVAYAIGFMIGLAIRLWYKFMSWSLKLIGRLILGIINFFIKLPGRIQSIMTRAGQMLIQGLARMVIWAIENGPKIIAAIIRFFINLPGKIALWMGKAVAKLIKAAPAAFTAAVEFGSTISEAIVTQIQGLPDLVWDLLQKVVQAFLDVIGAAWDAAKGVGGALWDGFKDGIGLNSPSYIEQAMFQVNKTMGEELKKLSKQTIGVQKLSKKFASTQFVTPALPTLTAMTANKRLTDKMSDIQVQRSEKPAELVAAAVGEGKKETYVEVTVNNPEPERAGQSVSKVMRDRKEDEDW